MTESLYETAIIFTVGVAVIMLVQWSVFYKKDIRFRKKYHPLMTIIVSLGFGILGAIAITDEDSPIWFWILIVISVLAVAVVDIMKRQICTNCGYEANEYAINGFFTHYYYCLKCGSSYDKAETIQSK